MKCFVVVFAAAVAASLVCYFSFGALFGFRLSGNQVLVHVDVFIAFIACLSALAAILGLSFWFMLTRSDRRTLQRLEQRMAALESLSDRGAAQQ